LGLALGVSVTVWGYGLWLALGLAFLVTQVVL